MSINFTLQKYTGVAMSNCIRAHHPTQLIIGKRSDSFANSVLEALSLPLWRGLLFSTCIIEFTLTFEPKIQRKDYFERDRMESYYSVNLSLTKGLNQ